MTPTDTSQRRRGRTPVTLAAALTAALISLLVTACTDTLDAVDSLAQPVTPAWTVALETLGTPNHTVGERILTTAMDGESATRMVGLDLADGSEVWSRPIGAWSRDRALVLVDTEEGHRAVDVGPARSQRINATWEGVLLAWTVRTSALQLLDPHDGEVAAAHPVPDHGLVASVEDVGDFLHVVAAVPTQPDPAGPAEDGTWPLGREVRDYIFDPRSATFSDPTDLGLEVPWVPLTDGLAMTWPEGSATPSLVSLRHEDAGHSVPLPDTLSLTRETLLTRAKATGRVPDSGHVAFGAAGATGDGEVDLASFRTILVDLDSGELVTGPLPGRPCGSRGGDTPALHGHRAHRRGRAGDTGGPPRPLGLHRARRRVGRRGVVPRTIPPDEGGRARALRGFLQVPHLHEGGPACRPGHRVRRRLRSPGREHGDVHLELVLHLRPQRPRRHTGRPLRDPPLPLRCGPRSAARGRGRVDPRHGGGRELVDPGGRRQLRPTPRPGGGAQD